MDQSVNNAVNVYKEESAIVIQGTESGKNINLYTTSGTLIHSAVAKDDVLKIKVPKHHLYVVHLGQERFKIALF